MRLLLLTAAAAVLLTACATTSAAPAPATPRVSLELPEPNPNSIVRVVERIETSTYLVEGDTANEIRASLNSRGPYSQTDGRIYDALTRWGIGWSFRYGTGQGACWLETATIELAVVIVLPELQDEASLAPPVRNRWNEYHDALTEHEGQHVEGVQRGVRALQAAFDAAPALPTCNELGAHLNDLGNVYEEAMRAADIEYDRETGHGKTEGAAFP